jgi:hypothetical protein
MHRRLHTAYYQKVLKPPNRLCRISYCTYGHDLMTLRSKRCVCPYPLNADDTLIISYKYYFVSFWHIVHRRLLSIIE